MLALIAECQECWGTGEITHNISPGGPLITEPCPACNATGMRVNQRVGIDDTTVNDILDKCNDILDKCKDICDKLNE